MRNILVFLAFLWTGAAASAQQVTPPYVAGGDPHAPLFPTDVVATPKGDLLIANKGERSVRLYDPANLAAPAKTWKFSQSPTGLALQGDRLYVTCFEKQGTLAVIDLAAGSVAGEYPAAYGAISPVMSADGSKVYVMGQFAAADNVVEMDAASGQVLRTARVPREPKNAVVSKDGKYLFVANFLPAQRADVDYVAAEVSVIELAGFSVVKHIKLANGSNALRGMTLSEDGKYVFVSHNLGRFAVPTTQIAQGWMNTSAMSVIEIEKLQFLGSLILDDPARGAAGIWDIKTVPGLIFVTHSGTHDLSVIDYPKMVAKLNTYKNGIETLAYDLRFMYDLRERIPLQGNGPRKMAIAGDNVYIPTYFSDTLNVFSISERKVASFAGLVPGRTESLAQQGERIFNDAIYCSENWQSCNGCHPGDARTDGMNWDLQNDGIGNPKNCKSLLYSHVTPPSMISGIRASAELAVRKGFEYIQFHVIPEEMAVLVDEYLKTLRPVPSALLVDGKLSENAELGRKVFEKLGCDQCHYGPYFTDMSMHRIGADVEFSAGWDTPTLIEVWRTAPYLFDGRAATMHDVFAVHKHGIEGRKVSEKEINQLVEYVNSL